MVAAGELDAFYFNCLAHFSDAASVLNAKIECAIENTFGTVNVKKFQASFYQHRWSLRMRTAQGYQQEFATIAFATRHYMSINVKLIRHLNILK